MSIPRASTLLTSPTSLLFLSLPSLLGQSIGKSDLVRYDFVDGTDNGMEVPVARRRAELAEVSVDVRNQQEKVKEKIETAQKVAEFQALTRKAANETNKE